MEKALRKSQIESERQDKKSRMKNTGKTDKRVYKTRQNLKSTMLRMMDSKPFEKIYVTELCREANTSRITFYTYYEDKYDLLQDIYNDMQQEMEDEFVLLQRENNAANDPKQSYRNLAVSVIHMYAKNLRTFQHLDPLESPEILKSLYHFAMNHFMEFGMHYNEHLKNRYSTKQLSTFLITGFWGFAAFGNDSGVSQEKMQKDALQLFDDLLDSKIFGGKTDR